MRRYLHYVQSVIDSCQKQTLMARFTEEFEMAHRIFLMTINIVLARARQGRISTDELVGAIKMIHSTLLDLVIQERSPLQTAHTNQRLRRIRSKPHLSIKQQHVVCLECGQQLLSLNSKHLQIHGLNPVSYKQKYGLPPRQVLSSRNVTGRQRDSALTTDRAQYLRTWRKRRDSQHKP